MPRSTNRCLQKFSAVKSRHYLPVSVICLQSAECVRVEEATVSRDTAFTSVSLTHSRLFHKDAIVTQIRLLAVRGQGAADVQVKLLTNVLSRLFIYNRITLK